MPERQAPVAPATAMRAATSGERVTDRVRDMYEAIAQQPLGQIADLLGLTDFKGIVEHEFTDPDQLKLGVASRRMPGAKAFGAAGHRIPKGTQSSMGADNKIPRFRSEHGTFVKHEGAWWRIGKQPSDALNITLERLPPGPELAELAEQGIAPQVLETKVIQADALMPKRAKPGK